MKKKILILFIGILCIFTLFKFEPVVYNTIYKEILHYKDYTVADFSDPEFFKCLYDSFKGATQSDYTNAKLTDANLAAITTTGNFCKDRGITSIEGDALSKLTKLATLNLSNEDEDDTNNNDISSINTSALTALTTLNLNGVGLVSYDANNNGANITTLNLSNNRLNPTGYVGREGSKLVTLELSGNSQMAMLTNLDLTKDTLLRNIKINNNKNITNITFPTSITGTQANVNIEIKDNARLGTLTMPETITTTNASKTDYVPIVNISNNGELLTNAMTINMPTTITSGAAKPIVTISNNKKLENIVMPSIVTTKTSTAEVIIDSNDDLKTINTTNMQAVPIVTISNNKKLENITMATNMTTSTATTYTIENNSSDGVLSTLTLPEGITTNAAFTLNVKNNKVSNVIIPNVIKGSTASTVNINIEDNSSVNSIDYAAKTIGQTGASTLVIKNNNTISNNNILKVPYSAGTMTLEITNNGFSKVDLDVPPTETCTDDDNCTTTTLSSKLGNLAVSNNSNLSNLVLPAQLNTASAISLQINENDNLSSLVLPTQINNKGLATFTINNNSKLATLTLPGTETNVTGMVADLRNNSLTSLNTSAATKLTELYVDNGETKNNKLTTLDLSNNTILVKLNTSNNDLTTLTTSSNKLTDLYATNNKLTELNLSGSAALKMLDIRNNLLTNLTLPSAKTITTLYAQNNKLTTAGIVNLLTHTSMVTMDLSDNDLNSTCTNEESENAYVDGVCPDGSTETILDFNRFTNMTTFILKNNRGDLRTIKLPYYKSGTNTVASKLVTLNIENSNSLVNLNQLQNQKVVKNLTITNNPNIKNLSFPVGAAGAVADLSNNGLETITINGTDKVNNFVSLDLSNNKLNKITNLDYLTKVKDLDLHNNEFEEITISNAALTDLNIGEKNKFKHQITMYVGESIDVTTKNPVAISKPTGKTMSILEDGLVTDDTDLKIEGNNVSSNKPGNYTSVAHYQHNINESNNTFRVENDIHVVSIEGNNDRYETITSDGKQYLYIRNYNATDDALANIVGNLKVNGTSSYINISKPVTKDKVTTMKVTEVGGDARALPTFTVIGLHSTDLSKYVIEKDGILVYNSTFDTSKVKLDATNSGVTLEMSEDNNELIIKNGNTEVKRMQVIYVNSDSYASYLTKDFIYDTGFSLSNISLTNGTAEITYKENCGTATAKCEILNIKNNGNVIKQYDIVRITSDIYEINDKYVLSLNHEFSLSNINPRTATISLNSNENELIVKYKDEDVTTLDIGTVTAPYNLNNNQILTLKTDYNEFDIYKIDDLFETGKKAVVALNSTGDQVILKINNRNAKTYNLVRPTSINIGNDFGLLKGKTNQLSPIINNNSNYVFMDELNYISSDSSIVTVSDKGLVNGVTVGSATIKACTNETEPVCSNEITVDVSQSVNIKYRSDGVVFKEEVYASDTDIYLETAEKTGYTLIGYTDGTNTYNIENQYHVTENVTLDAIWQINKYNLTVNLNGGTSTQTFNEQYDYNANVTLLSPTKVGYTFSGWNITGATLNNNSFTFGTKDVVLTANWTANKYTVTYVPNGGTVSSPTKQVTYDSAYGILEEPTKAGYTFKGWYKEEEFTNQVTGSTIVKMTSSHNLYAKWEAKNYTVNFVATNGTITGETSKTVTYGNTYGTLPTASNSNPNMHFVGWYTDEMSGTLINSSTTVSIAKNHTLYARFDDTTNYKIVTYNFGGGTCLDIEDNSFRVESGKAIGDLCIPTKDAYTFKGWYKEVSYINLVTKDTIVNDNMDIYAKWAYKPKLTVNLDGGSTTQKFEQRYDIGSEITLVNPTKSGYTFAGWKLSSSSVDSDSRLVNNKLIVGYQDVVLTANYTSNTVKVRVSYSPSTGCSAKDVTVGSTYGTLCTPPVKKDHAFMGWYTASTGGTLVTSSTKVTNNKSHILYARYEALDDRVNNNTNYNLENNQLSEIKIGTSITTNLGFKNDVSTKIYDSKGVIKSTGNLYTGDLVKVYQNNNEIGKYTIIVKGDVVGNGKITVADVAKLYQYLRGKITMDDAYIKAGNVVSSDTVIKVNDVAKLYQYLKGKIKEL